MREQIEPAARALVEEHSVQLIATARRYSLSAEDAEDAFQRGLEILLTRAPSSLRSDELVPWLKTVVKHEAFAIRKARKRAELAGDPDLAGWGHVPPAHEQAERLERLRVGVEAMSRLSHRRSAACCCARMATRTSRSATRPAGPTRR
jgi:DNA-directed RNA polymerase specialized sigma24 family protein